MWRRADGPEPGKTVPFFFPAACVLPCVLRSVCCVRVSTVLVGGLGVTNGGLWSSGICHYTHLKIRMTTHLMSYPKKTEHVFSARFKSSAPAPV